MPIKILSVFGTRPDAIKMCPLVKLLGSDSRFESVVCVSAQHREMLDQVLEIFDVHPDYDLNIMKPSQTLFQISAALIPGFGDVLEEVKPEDWKEQVEIPEIEPNMDKMMIVSGEKKYVMKS